MRRPEIPSSLIIASLGLVAGSALATTTLPVGVRALGAIALAFALPGAALSAAMLPRVTLRWSERVGLAVGGSLSVAIGAAFVLHLMPTGMTASSWAMLLGGLTVAGGLVGWVRTLRRPTPVPVPDPAGAAAWVAGPPASFAGVGLVSPWTIAMLAAAGVLVALSLVIARSGLALGPTARFTELWLLPLDGGAAVRIGVANHEGAPEAYRLVVTVDGRPLGTPTQLTLAAGTATDAIVELPAHAKGARAVEARLWLADQPDSDPPQRAVRAVVTQDAAVTP